MEQFLNLSIELTPPPSESPPGVLASIVVHCDSLGFHHTGGLLTNPLTPQSREDLRWYLEEYWKWPYEQFAARGKQIEESLPVLGKQLYESVFGSIKTEAGFQEWNIQGDSQRTLSIVSTIPEALNLPWELLHNEQGFLALREAQPVSIIRHLPQKDQVSPPIPFKSPLRILLVTPRPVNASFVDPRSIAHELVEELKNQVNMGNIEIEFLRPPTFKQLRSRLEDQERPVHVLHFDGHGTFNVRSKGALAFENEGERLNLITARQLAQILQQSGVRLVILTACQSAVSTRKDVWSSVAAQLIRGNSTVDAVIAMSASILTVSAARYVEAFYHALAEGIPVQFAQERARLALFNDPRRHPYHRHFDKEGPSIQLYDWWLPHFYQKLPLTLSVNSTSHLVNNQSASLHPNEVGLDEQNYPFIGRAQELLQLERWLRRGKIAVIHGFGGIGKSSLLRETSNWLVQTKMFDRACYISFEQGGDASTLLSTLGTALEVYDGQYNPRQVEMALQQLNTFFQEKRILVILDNLESILPHGNAVLEAAARHELWDVLFELSRMGNGILLASQNTNFGDERFVAKSHIAYLELKGLDPEDAYALATHLMVDLSIVRERVPYLGLRELLAQLDHHPLAIRLVMPALQEIPLSKIKTDFENLLPYFRDDTLPGHHRSLLASLNYSMQRLNSKQKVMMSHLALFEGGASEDDLLKITEIPKAQWSRLRRSLEQVGLLTAETVGSFVAPFLHFHPVLTPYLRSLKASEDASLHLRYLHAYSTLARYLYQHIFRDPFSARALFKWELPNLQRALEIHLEEGNVEAASNIAHTIAKFLADSGRWRERDELRKKIDAAKLADIQENSVLSQADFEREFSIGDEEWKSGNVHAAFIRFTTLLNRIESQPKESGLGQGTYAHMLTFMQLARCLESEGQYAAAEKLIHAALNINDTHISVHPDDEQYMGHRATLLGDLGNILLAQGQYSQARAAFEESLHIHEQRNDLRGQATALSELGSLAIEQQDYDNAWMFYTQVRDIFHSLNEPTGEAIALHNLGRIASRLKMWDEAERCYRESLALKERMGNLGGAAVTCNQLGTLAIQTNRLNEAEGWYKRALELENEVNPGSLTYAKYLDNLANLLLRQVQKNLAPASRLREAWSYAQQALAIMEPLDVSSESWVPLGILAVIADLLGSTETAKAYRLREHQIYAASAANRYQVANQYGTLINLIARIAKDKIPFEHVLKEILQEKEAQGIHITAVIPRLLEGERDWHTLTADLDSENALLILLILETIADWIRKEPVPAFLRNLPEQVLKLFPVSIQQALKEDSKSALDQAMLALTPEEKSGVSKVMLDLMHSSAKTEAGPSLAEVVQKSEPMLRDIASAIEDSAQQGRLMAGLGSLGAKGEAFRTTIQRLWNGEHDIAVLKKDLHEPYIALLQRILEILEEE